MVGSLLPNWEILNAIGLMLTMSAWTGFLFGGRARALSICLVLGSLAVATSFVSILMAFTVTPTMPPWSTPILVMQVVVLPMAWVPLVRSKIVAWILGLVLSSVILAFAVYRPIFQPTGTPMSMAPGLSPGPPPTMRPGSDQRGTSPAGPPPFGNIKPPPANKKYIPPIPEN